jgi:hypothetical protein
MRHERSVYGFIVVIVSVGPIPTLGTIPQKYKTGNEKRSYCSAAYLFYPFSTSQNLEVKTIVKMTTNKGIGLTDRYPIVFSLPVLYLCGVVPRVG